MSACVVGEVTEDIEMVSYTVTAGPTTMQPCKSDSDSDCEDEGFDDAE